MAQLLEFIGNHPFLFVALGVVSAALAWNLFSGNIGRGKPLSVNDAVALINREKAVVVDLRPQEQFDKGHIVNALHLPPSEQSEAPKRLQKHKQRPLLLYCPTGMQAPAVAATLVTAGFEQVYRLRGGMADWQAEKMPVRTA